MFVFGYVTVSDEGRQRHQYDSLRLSTTTDGLLTILL